MEERATDIMLGIQMRAMLQRFLVRTDSLCHASEVPYGGTRRRPERQRPTERDQRDRDQQKQNRQGAAWEVVRQLTAERLFA